jgi:hypothetical protein
MRPAIPALEALSASLTRAIELASSKCPEAVQHIAPVLSALALIQLDMAQFKTSKQRTLEQMVLLEKKLVRCDPGERAAYIMNFLELPQATYYDYRKLLRERGAIPNDSELLGVSGDSSRIDL